MQELTADTPASMGPLELLGARGSGDHKLLHRASSLRLFAGDAGVYKECTR